MLKTLTLISEVSYIENICKYNKIKNINMFQINKTDIYLYFKY